MSLVSDLTSGWVSDGFAPILQAFASSDLGRGGASFAAYVDGEPVVDLWRGEASPGKAWGENTLTTMMSTTKGCAALCAQVLYDRGLLDVEAPVTEYWREYGQAGKERTTVRHILDHTSGMLCFTDPGALLDWSGGGWDDYDEIARRIAASPPAWEPGTQIGYHAISIGWLLQELVRRIDGRMLGRFFAEEIAQPLGLDIFIGTPVDVQPRVAEIMSDASVAAGGPTAGQRLTAKLLTKVFARPATRMGQAMISMHGSGLWDVQPFLNQPRVRALEIPAANASGDARSLARMYAVLAQGGELDGVRLMSKASVDAFRQVSSSGPSALPPFRRLRATLGRTKMHYALGYEGDFGKSAPARLFGPTPISFGHLGAGGQIGFADPERRVSVGFVRNHVHDWSVSTELINTLYDCLDAQEGSV